MNTINLKTSFQRVACINADKYVTKAVRYSTIGQEDLIKYASENSGIAKAQMSAAFYALTQQIEQFVLNGHGLELGNLGTIYLSTRTKVKDTESEAGAAAVVGLSIRFRQSGRMRRFLKNNVALKTLREYEDTDDENGGGNGSGNTESGGGSGTTPDSDLDQNPFG